MVDANTTRATSKKIKDSASSKRSEDISVANALVPSLNASSGDPEGVMPVSKTAGTPSGSSLPSIGVVSNVVAGKKNTPNETAVDDTVFSLLVDTSETRRDRAPAASLQFPSTAKTGNSAASQIIEDKEEDNSPDIAVSSIMSERQQMWSRAITAQNSGDLILAEMLFKAIGRIGSNAEPDPTPRNKVDVFAIPTQSASGAVIYKDTAIAPPSDNHQAAVQNPEKFYLTEGDLVYAIGTVTNHNSVGFAPFLDENIRKLRSPLPLTIFNRKWQQRAMAHHLDRRQRSEDSSSDKEKVGGYKGFAFVQEWTQTYAQWTRNHRAFRKTLHDVYKIIKFSKLLATHKNNCDDITEEFGFMVAFRYDMEVRSNTFSHRITDEDVKNAIPDISQRKESVVEQCYNVCRNFGELEWEENLYAPGMSHSNHDPLTGYLKPSKYGNSYNNNYQNNQMIQNPGAHGNWAHQQHNSYQPYNHNQNRNQNNTYQQNNSNGPNSQSGNK
ncbi:uncharacterized protein PGTG_14766 [Puccinia graminis f. sp. tritici CRL 75-36-700-3]|uniref:Uncharacterized protein n=1 Tax=Puccinia graminis f. sp. tritici (strain CRL 75-36-700-3 / race SCCL) TaxID=418459 RepID=E3KW86_PUCGT|nr:uncharacterized protein PGTG_14766 [Puccinia graminis f. sp. tritici CRL 75-36-700-3]EFP88561.1 hypothetical protein PGTG_14766 [Puccinia graminis f. sp. tritici CRL 75-36-700-3]